MGFLDDDSRDFYSSMDLPYSAYTSDYHYGYDGR